VGKIAEKAVCRSSQWEKSPKKQSVGVYFLPFFAILQKKTFRCGI